MYLNEKLPGLESPPVVDAVGQILLKAADEIRQRGWAQRALCDNWGGVCLRGAIMAAKGVDPRRGFIDDTAELTRVKNFLGVTDAVSWNNARERTKEQVIAALEKAAHN